MSKLSVSQLLILLSTIQWSATRTIDSTWTEMLTSFVFLTDHGINISNLYSEIKTFYRFSSNFFCLLLRLKTRLKWVLASFLVGNPVQHGHFNPPPPKFKWYSIFFIPINIIKSPSKNQEKLFLFLPLTFYKIHTTIILQLRSKWRRHLKPDIRWNGESRGPIPAYIPLTITKINL